MRRQIFVSCDYRVISESEARASRAAGWFSPFTVARQGRAYVRLLQEMRSGSPRIDLRVAAEAVDSFGASRISLLEVGCGSGYYSEVFARLPKCEVEYAGMDYSPAMIKSARRNYPLTRFEVADATNMPFQSGSFDVVFNGVSLMHILDYEKAIAEAARVARLGCIFHSVVLFDRRSTTYVHKYAYGSPVTEVIFNRDELLACLRRNRLTVVRSWPSIPYDLNHLVGEASHTETFMCQKQTEHVAT